jgi:hypothetical protein
MEKGREEEWGGGGGESDEKDRIDQAADKTVEGGVTLEGKGKKMEEIGIGGREEEMMKQKGN